LLHVGDGGIVSFVGWRKVKNVDTTSDGICHGVCSSTCAQSRRSETNFRTVWPALYQAASVSHRRWSGAVLHSSSLRA